MYQMYQSLRWTHHELQNGNVIAVRLCARFAQWSIAARNGYLIVDVGTENGMSRSRYSSRDTLLLTYFGSGT